MLLKKILTFGLLSLLFNNQVFANDKYYLCSQPGVKINLKQQYLYVRTACTYEQLTKGLNVEDLTVNSGLLYVLGKEGIFKFWTKYTPMSVDIIYLNNNLEIVDMGSLKPSEEVIFSNKKPASYVLEVNYGWTKQYSVKIGDKIEIIRM